MLLRVRLTLPSLNEAHLMSVSTRGMKLSENLITDLVETSK
jgi:ribosomal protein L28